MNVVRFLCKSLPLFWHDKTNVGPSYAPQPKLRQKMLVLLTQLKKIIAVSAHFGGVCTNAWWYRNPYSFQIYSTGRLLR